MYLYMINVYFVKYKILFDILFKTLPKSNNSKASVRPIAHKQQRNASHTYIKI